jgi:hypothetical protein
MWDRGNCPLLVITARTSQRSNGSQHLAHCYNSQTGYTNLLLIKYAFGEAVWDRLEPPLRSFTVRWKRAQIAFMGISFYLICLSLYPASLPCSSLSRLSFYCHLPV